MQTALWHIHIQLQTAACFFFSRERLEYSRWRENGSFSSNLYKIL